MGRGGMDEDDRRKLYASCCCVITIVSVFLFAFSFDTIDISEWGLWYNSVHLSINPAGTNGAAFKGGRYFTGVGAHFLIFPRRNQYIEYSNAADGGARNLPLTVWSKDGQEIILEVGFYYRLIPEKLYQVYNEHGHDKVNKRDPWISYFEDLAQWAIKDVTTGFVTTEFFTRRAEINAALEKEVRARMVPAGGNVTNFNLLGIQVPSQFENAVIDKVIKGQQKKILEFKQISTDKRAQITVIKEYANFNITVLMAAANANATVTQTAQTAAAFQRKVDTETNEYKKLSLALGFHTNATGSSPATSDNHALLNYLWSSTVKRSGKNTKLVTGFADPFVSVGAGQ